MEHFLPPAGQVDATRSPLALQADLKAFTWEIGFYRFCTEKGVERGWNPLDLLTKFVKNCFTVDLYSLLTSGRVTSGGAMFVTSFP